MSKAERLENIQENKRFERQLEQLDDDTGLTPSQTIENFSNASSNNLEIDQIENYDPPADYSGKLEESRRRNKHNIQK